MLVIVCEDVCGLTVVERANDDVGAVDDLDVLNTVDGAVVEALLGELVADDACDEVVCGDVVEVGAAVVAEGEVVCFVVVASLVVVVDAGSVLVVLAVVVVALLVLDCVDEVCPLTAVVTSTAASSIRGQTSHM